MPYIRTDVKDVYGKMMNVICPKCQKTHKMRMLWIGNGTPRKFCQACLHNLNHKLSGGMDDGSSFNRKACAMRLSTRP